MRTGTARGLAVAAVLLALLGCSAEREPADGPAATPSATPTSVDILRIDDDGASVTLEVGGTATVFLPASYVWEEPVIDGDAVTISADVWTRAAPAGRGRSRADRPGPRRSR